MDVWALGVQNRGVNSVIAPNQDDHLECEECGMCIDICPVGALTSGAYRYKTRPWEMKHVGTVCTHCGDGCKTTLGVRRSDTGAEIVRGGFTPSISTGLIRAASGPTSTLKHSRGASSIGARISFCFTVGSITVGLVQPIFSLAQAERCCGRPSSGARRREPRDSMRLMPA